MNRTSPRSVLLVDDDAEIRHALKLVFEFEEFQVVGEATDGLEAVRKAAELRPDFVILDYYMPRLDGRKAAKLLREVDPDVRIVAFSAILADKPRWADAFLNKDRLSAMGPLLRALVKQPLSPLPDTLSENGA